MVSQRRNLEWPTVTVRGWDIVFVWRNRKDKAESILSVQIKSIQPFLSNKPKGLIKSESSDIVIFGFENNLVPFHGISYFVRTRAELGVSSGV